MKRTNGHRKQVRKVRRNQHHKRSLSFLEIMRLYAGWPVSI